MANVRIAHTADLDVITLEAARALLDDAFEGDFSDDDWDHALGGMHALIWEDVELIGHASVIQRRLLHGGHALRAGYVEGVCVRADRRRHGHGGELMAALERVIHAAYDLGALSSSAAALELYEARGWRRWQGRTFALTPEGIVRTEDGDESVFVLPTSAPLDLAGELVCDWRDGALW